GSLPEALRGRTGVAGGSEGVLPLLQREEVAPGAGLPDAGAGVPGQPAGGVSQGKQKRHAALVRIVGGFQGITPVSHGRERSWPMGQQSGSGARGGCTIGAPSAGLSLGGLLASRARLCFTRRGACTARAAREQEQAAGTSGSESVSVRRAGRGVAKERSSF